MKAFVIAGEPSGDRLGAELLKGLLQESPKIEFSGVAGPLMQAQGCPTLFPMSDLSVMGIAEILPKYRHLKRRIRETAKAIISLSPDVVISIDSPDFSLRVAKLVKAVRPSQKIVHYVAPSVWAWRPKRATKMAKVVDHVLALLPFEPPYMHKAGMSCDFVGHPIAEDPVITSAQIDIFRQDHAIGGSILAVLPGSRKGEINRLMPIFVETLLASDFSDYTLVFPTLPQLKPMLEPYLDQLPQRTLFAGVSGSDAVTETVERRVAMAAADGAMAASGTISLDLAAVNTPMVIAYTASWLSRKIITWMLRIDTVTLVNLVSETRVVPECLADDCTAQNLIPALRGVLANPERQQDAMHMTMQRLGRGGEKPGVRAAKSVLNFLNQP